MKLDVVERVRAYQEVFATDNGKIVLEDMKMAHHMLSSTYKKDLQEGELAFREGERNVVLRIVHILGQDLAKLKERATQNEKDSQ